MGLETCNGLKRYLKYLWCCNISIQIRTSRKGNSRMWWYSMPRVIHFSHQGTMRKVAPSKAASTRSYSEDGLRYVLGGTICCQWNIRKPEIAATQPAMTSNRMNCLPNKLQNTANSMILQMWQYSSSVCLARDFAGASLSRNILSHVKSG